MKKLPLLRIFLLMMVLSLFHTVSVSASQKMKGSLEIFNGSVLSGWVYNAGDLSAAGEVQILISDSTSGQTVKTISVTPDAKREDLSVPEGISPGFTATLDMSSLPDGVYSAAAYAGGQKFSESVYYIKKAGTEGTSAGSLTSLGVFTLTAYCPCRSCSAGWGARTSSGATAAAGHTIAVDPKVIPMGSRLLINGTVYTAEDVGGGVKGNHVDIFFNGHSQAKQFGRQSAGVYLIR